MQKRLYEVADVGERGRQHGGVFSSPLGKFRAASTRPLHAGRQEFRQSTGLHTAGYDLFLNGDNKADLAFLYRSHHHHSDERRKSRRS